MSTKWTIKSTLFVLALGVLTVSTLAFRSNADEKSKTAPSPEEIAKAMAEAAKPGPEHAKLDRLAGKWTYTGKCWMMPDQPPMEMKGTVQRKWILGGKFLEERISGTGFGDGKFESFGLFGYDKGTKKYTWTFACNMGTGASNGVGAEDAEGKLVYHATCFCPMEQKVITARDEIRFEGKDKVVLESFKIENGKDVKMMEIVAVRQK
jgi:hypothetical protein